VYLLYYVCIAVFTLDSGLLARSQYSEGPTTDHLDTGFSCFRCVYKQMPILGGQDKNDGKLILLYYYFFPFFCDYSLALGIYIYFEYFVFLFKV